MDGYLALLVLSLGRISNYNNHLIIIIIIWIFRTGQVKMLEKRKIFICDKCSHAFTVSYDREQVCLDGSSSFFFIVASTKYYFNSTTKSLNPLAVPPSKAE